MSLDLSLLKKKPLIIAGPCSAETEEQLLDTARAIARTGMVDILRAGVWKPRTKPGHFEGAGKPALAWLRRAREETKLPLIVEVASTAHVEACLEAEIDAVWIGARTTVNPFSVQEIAQALKGTNLPILIKNPVSADIDLWSGAIDRCTALGHTHVGLIHRGFSSYLIKDLRNAPIWQIPIEMKRRYPELPLICDPSHIAGTRKRIRELSQYATNLQFDGLMIEVHRDPQAAWTDAAQQITPESLEKLLRSLVWKRAVSEDIQAEARENLEKLREKIDAIDNDLIKNLARRMEVVYEIAELKKVHNLALYQPDRWNILCEKFAAKSKDYDLNADFLHTLFEHVHVESINQQNQILYPRAEQE